MGEKEEINNVPKSILEEILEYTFQKLEDNNDFDSKLILKLKKLASEDSIREIELISTLRGESQ